MTSREFIEQLDAKPNGPIWGWAVVGILLAIGCFLTGLSFCAWIID